MKYLTVCFFVLAFSVVSTVTYAEITDKKSSPAAKSTVQPDQSKATPKKKAEASQSEKSSTDASKKDFVDVGKGLGDKTASQPAAKSVSPIVQFVITDIQRGLTRDRRVLSSPRVVTMQVLSPRRPLKESLWKGKMLEVFRLISVGMSSRAHMEADEENVMPHIPPVRLMVGTVKIKSVHGMTVQAVVQGDDLTSGDGLSVTGDARVVMLGDLAERPTPKVREVKQAPRRVRKAKKLNPFQRKDMRWKL
jgi:hypothetical protein